MRAAAAALSPAFVRQAGAADVVRFAQGVASGQPHACGRLLWTGLAGPAPPSAVDGDWELAEDVAFGRVAARGAEDAVKADAHGTHAEPAGLVPDRAYWHRVRALGRHCAVGCTCGTTTRSTTTAPEGGARSCRATGEAWRTSSCSALPDPRRGPPGAEQEAWLARGWSIDRTWNLLASACRPPWPNAR